MKIEVSTKATHFLRQLVEKQEEEGLGLRLKVVAPGTPQANCELVFCGQGENQADDEQLVVEGLSIYIEADSIGWLEDAQIDYQNTDTGGRLNIRAPKIKGSAPAEEASLFERVSWLIDTEINPSLASHRGHVELVDVNDEGVVALRFGGGCQGCGMVNVTLQNGIEKTLKERLPEVKLVIDATDHTAGTNPYY